jgi:hypothetical protein
MNYKIALMLAFAAASANSTNATEERDPNGYFNQVTRSAISTLKSCNVLDSLNAMKYSKAINGKINALSRQRLDTALPGLAIIREIADQTQNKLAISDAFENLKANPAYAAIKGQGPITLDQLSALTGCGNANDWLSTLTSKGMSANDRLPASGASVETLKVAINASGTSYHLASEIMEKLLQIAVEVKNNFDAGKGTIQITGIPAQVAGQAAGQPTTHEINKNVIAKAVEQHINVAINTVFDKFKNLLDNSSVFVSRPQVKMAYDIQTIFRKFFNTSNSMVLANANLQDENTITQAITQYNSYIANGGPEANAGPNTRQAILVKAIYGNANITPQHLPLQQSGAAAANNINALTGAEMLALLPPSSAKSLDATAEEIELGKQVKAIRKGQQVRLLTADFIQDQVINKARQLQYNANNALPFINNMLTNLETISSRGDFKTQEDMNNAINTLNKIEKNASNPIGEFARTGEIFGVSFTSDAIKSAQADLSDKIKAAREKLSVKAKALGLSMDPSAPPPAPAGAGVKIDKDTKLPEVRKIINSASLDDTIVANDDVKEVAVLNLIKSHNDNVATLASFKSALESEDDTKGEVTLASFKKALVESKSEPKLKVALRNAKFFQAVTKAIGSIEGGEQFKKSVTAYVNSLKKPDTQSPRKKVGGRFARRTGKRAQQVKGGKRAQQVKGGKRAQQVKGGKREQQVKGGKRAQAEANNPVQAKKAAAA